ncbi:glycosyltransferase [Lacinutrix sp. MedPE-SW]|uniref:glycosyltransferase n=1 Tax=Lacinutrix sp. MedPE-SW TaxID=1860087 RepID=UPI00091F733B|nr:glycosyltransferase [Lacinutrix sp. MedPE-SW]OIQ22707.1 MAG: glycosyltransferase [Lacinutrix sp. MedPE-SW]
MKVLQLIDSLHAGGAERIAVSLANTLSETTNKSYLCATREEGFLKESLDNKVSYLFLKKKSSLDISAISRLHNFIKTEGIDIIHAHSSSYFLATLIKILNKKVRIVWHDHYGNRANITGINNKVLKQCSKYFFHIVCVNHNLVTWAQENLYCKNISYLKNFVIENKSVEKTKLLGKSRKRIICLANLRPDKDLLNAIEAFSIVLKNNPDWTLHLVGKNFNDDYAKSIEHKIKTLNISKEVFLYGSVPDSLNVLRQGNIGILSSKSEGLPVALLEYGLAGLPVVVTNVGDCAEVILDGKLGKLVPAKNSELLAVAIQDIIANPKHSKVVAANFNKHILKHFSASQAIEQLTIIYKKSLL